MEKEFSNLKLEDTCDINILLLGEAGVGKSTFVNSITNYFYCRDLDRAMQGYTKYMIPYILNFTDENSIREEADVGLDQLIGISATKDVEDYVFSLENGKNWLRLIDTPGLRIPEGEEGDDIICNNIFSKICQFKRLHAICLFFTPNDPNIIRTLKYYSKQIFSRLEVTAASNIIFVFTNSKATNYKPVECINYLKSAVLDIRDIPPHATINVEENVFCFDNESFAFLVAFRNGLHVRKEDYIMSWMHSCAEAWKMVRYIVGDASHDALVPHSLESCKSIYDTRRIMKQLLQPLADISSLILDNLHVVDHRQKELQEDNVVNLCITKAREKLVVPVVKLKVMRMVHPVILCCSVRCGYITIIDGRTSWNYLQYCHECTDFCGLRNVSEDDFGILGARELGKCGTINTTVCNNCQCSAEDHMRTIYIVKRFGDSKKYTNFEMNVRAEVDAALLRIRQELIRKRTELEYERDVIISCAAKFTGFLQRTAMKSYRESYRDPYRKYMNFIVARDRTHEEKLTNQFLEIYLAKYDDLKKIYNKLRDLPRFAGAVKRLEVEDIQNELHRLFSLKHTGEQLRELYSIRDNWNEVIQRTGHSNAITMWDPREIQRNERNSNETNLQPDRRYHPNQKYQRRNTISELGSVSDDYPVFSDSNNSRRSSLSQYSRSQSSFSAPQQLWDDRGYRILEACPTSTDRSNLYRPQSSRDYRLLGEIHPRGTCPPNNAALNNDSSLVRDFQSPYDPSLYNYQQHPGNSFPPITTYNQPPPSLPDQTQSTHSLHLPYDYRLAPQGAHLIYQTSSRGRGRGRGRRSGNAGPHVFRPPYEHPPHDARFSLYVRPPHYPQLALEACPSPDPRFSLNVPPPHNPQPFFDAPPPIDPRMSLGTRPPHNPQSSVDTRPYNSRSFIASCPAYNLQLSVDTRPYDSRSSLASCPPYNPQSSIDARPYDSRSSIGACPPYNPQSFVDTRPYDSRSSIASCPPYNPSSSVDARPYDSRSFIGACPPYNPQSSVDTRPYDARSSVASCPPYNPPTSVDARPYDSRSSIGACPPYNPQSSVDTRPYDARSSVASCPPYNPPRSVDARPYDSRSSIGACPPHNSQ